MKTLATIAFLLLVALPAGAAVVYDEGVNADLSSDPANPTALVFAPGSSTVIGTAGNVGSPADVRDYIRFTIPPLQMLTGLNLLGLSPDNLVFMSFNAGATSFIPSVTTNASFLSGIHASAADVGQDLMPFFVSRAVTTNALAAPQLGPGTYCFLIQQTSAITSSYQLEFVVQASVPVRGSTWGAIKSLYLSP